jgi:hypothetical protein
MFASCNIEQDLDIDLNGGQGLDFVHFEEPTISAVLTDSTCTYEVNLYSVTKSNKARTYELAVAQSTTGKEGVDFSIENKTITIPAGEFCGSTTVTCNYENVAENGFLLTIEVVAAEGVNFSPAYGNSMTFNFKTDKVTIDWNWLLGDWTETDYDFSGAVEYQSAAKIVKGENENEIIIKNFYETCDLVGTVDFEARTITFQPQFMLHYNDTYGDFHFVAYDYDTDEVIEGPVVATMSAAGITIGQWGAYGVDCELFLGYQLKTTFSR